MFESYEQAERERGFKGFVARHFGPVIYADAAEEGIRTIGRVFMILYAVATVFTLASQGGFFAFTLVAGALMITVAFLLYRTKSRVAAVILLVFAVINALFVLPKLLPWVWVLFAVRAIQLTFGYHRLRKTRTEVLSAME